MPASLHHACPPCGGGPQHTRQPGGGGPRHAPTPGGADRRIVLGEALHRSGREGHGLLLLAMAVPAGLPVPLSSLPAGVGQPAALAAAALGPGLLRRDGAIVLAGHGLTLAAVAWACFLLLAGHRLVAWAVLPLRA